MTKYAPYAWLTNVPTDIDYSLIPEHTGPPPAVPESSYVNPAEQYKYQPPTQDNHLPSFNPFDQPGW